MERKKERKIWNLKSALIVSIFVLADIALFMLLFSIFPNAVIAGVGTNNETITSSLAIGNAPPEVVSVVINDGNPIDLSANATTPVSVYVIASDPNGESDIVNISGEFFDNLASSFGASDDNNDHYTNTTCAINTAYGDATEVNATCLFNVEYYANNATWNATINATDSTSLAGFDSNTGVINTLLALGLPSNIDFGELNVTEVSLENVTNVTNFGNVMFNLSLSGYGHSVGDGNALNCTLGSTQNISIEHEKYNVTSSNSSNLSFTQLNELYRNLSSSPVVNLYNLNYRQNDLENEATNETYWRLYVPLGVAGSCTGNVVFGAVQATGDL